MSRTRRSDFRYFRYPKTRNAQVKEAMANQSLKEAGYNTDNRQETRSNPGSKKLPTARDDIKSSSHREKWRAED